MGILQFLTGVAVLVGLSITVSAQPLMERVPTAKHGIRFNSNPNNLPFQKELLKYTNTMVPGNGVAAGDLDGDGLPDLVFSSFRGLGIFRNAGNMSFQDITKQSGILTDSTIFSVGVTLVDIDGDGDLDIYVCRNDQPNRLYINNGKGRFVERAHAYRLDLVAECVNSVFFDYDRDGFLDCYIVIYSHHGTNSKLAAGKGQEIASASEQLQREMTVPRYGTTEKEQQDLLGRKRQSLSAIELRHSGAADVLMKNNGNGTFRDATYQAWISDEAMGLSATVADINLDGWPDIYVANDFNVTDHIYINNGDGSFATQHRKMVRRASVFSMGSDIADFNNDGLPDIITTDMLPRNHTRRITNSGSSGDASIYNPTYDSLQIMRNMLQLNRGNNQFSDIGYMTGIAATDWSWACLMADFDLDGHKDIFIANGYTTDLSNQDYVYNIGRMTADKETEGHFLTEPNFMFHNRGGLTFDDVSAAWGVADTSASLGAAYVDLDNDGDLDLVVGNIDTDPYVYRNNAVERGLGHFLRIRLKGPSGNSRGLGAKVRITYGSESQYLEQYPVRGFQSTMDDVMHFGTGSVTVLDSVIIQWPDGRTEIRQHVPVDQSLTLNHGDAGLATRSMFTLSRPDAPLFVDISGTTGLDYRQTENRFDDYKKYRMMPVRASWGGPPVAVADVNGDGLDDVIFGGAVGNHTQVYIQTKPGTFAPAAKIDPAGGTVSEVQAIVLVDIDGDGDRDLVVGAGGVEFEHDDDEMLSYIYLNDGKGQFTRDHTGRLPDVRTTATTIVAGDYDHDGAVDLFIGGGVGGQYPLPSRSFILRNDGKGRFKDVTDDVAPGLSSIGIVRAALWTDVDNDGHTDLFVVGEWMSITLFHNDGNGRFTNITAQAGLDSTVGWWYSINGADVDNDGDMDYVLGNIGLNNRYQTSAERPIEIWAADFDDNGSIDPLITYYPFPDEHKPYLMRDRGKIFSQMPTLNRKFNHYGQFASAPLDKVIDKEALDTAWHRAATLMKSIVLLNNGNKTFTIKPLPDMAQISPLLGTEFLDLNGDDNIDLVTVGNMYGAEDDVVRYDAGKGLVLLGDGSGGFTPVPLPEAGLVSPFDTRGIVMAKNTGSTDVPLVLITAVNQGRAESFKLNNADGVRVMALDPARVTHAMTVFEDGRKRKTEAYCGSAYRTQSSCNLVVPSGASRVILYYNDRIVEDKAVTKP